MEKKHQLLEEALSLERRAHELRAQNKIEEAFEVYDHAARLYREAGEHLKAAFCFASAATCWNIRTGWQPLKNAASRNEEAAREAAEAKNYDYALSLFNESAMLYEKDGDAEKYSVCYYEARRMEARRAWTLAVNRVQKGLAMSPSEVAWPERVLNLLKWLANTGNCILWGYGEKPFRTFGVAVCVILASSLFYQFSGAVTTPQGLRVINFGEALYFAIITFTTVGYGDYLPLTCPARTVAAMQALSGVLLTPLFVVGLTRRYLRIYR